MSIYHHGVRCIDLKDRTVHTPTPCSPNQQALFEDLRRREELGLTERYYGWGDASANTGVYSPNMNKPDTWMSDEEAKDWYQQCGVKHVQQMQRYQEKRMLNMLMREKLAELKKLQDRLMKR